MSEELSQSDERSRCSGSSDVDCSVVLADVWLFIDGECDEQSRQRVQSHLDNCSPCLTEFGIDKQVKSLLSRKCGGERAPEGLRERLVLSIQRTVIEYAVERESSSERESGSESAPDSR